MNIGEAHQKQIIDWIQSKCGAMRCICCGTHQWAILETASLPIGYDLKTTRFFYHQGIPQVALACQNCAHVVYFSANMMGLKADDPVEFKPGGA